MNDDKALSLSDEDKQELRNRGGEQLVERAQQLLADFQKLKARGDEPWSGAGVAKERLAEFRSLLQGLYDIHDDEKDRTSIQEVIATLSQVEDLLDPNKRAAMLLKRLSEPSAIKPDSEGLDQARAAFLAKPAQEQRQFLYLQRLALTDDAFGVIVRGHVLIENALQACIYAYVPHPADLYRKLELFFAQKVRLAHMLGIITRDESRILLEFNELRNQIAHFGKGTEHSSPDFLLTPEREEELWLKFVGNPAMKADWVEYDRSKFPLHLRYIVMHLYLVLSSRIDRLASKKLSPVIDEIVLSDLEAAVSAAVGPFLLNFLSALGDLEAEVPGSSD